MADYEFPIARMFVAAIVIGCLIGGVVMKGCEYIVDRFEVEITDTQEQPQ